MSFKDKPKREGGKPFDRDRKKTAAPKERSEMRTKAPRKADVAAAGVADATSNKPERISKILARAGIASRRDVERMIMEGRVRLNGQVLETPVVNATLSDSIEVDGQPIRGIERTRLWLYHKPAGLVTTNADPEGRPTVFDNLPDELPRVMSIGRLDINTEGLLLLTNDGGLSRVLELPTTGWLRRYRVRAHGEVSQEQLDKLKDGIAVDGVLYGAIDATLDRTQGHNVWITMGLREGKNREIKNVLGALGLDVNRLIRISYGPFQLGDLPEGQVVEVRGRMLRDQLGPRLIEEAKANFDAPIYSNAPADDEKPQPLKRAEKPSRETRSGDRDDRRGSALDRLDTKRGDGKREKLGFSKGGAKGNDRGGDKRGDKRFGGGDDRKFGDDRPKRPAMGTSRTANVWMAPGARPTVDGKGKQSARAEAERLFSKAPEENTRRVTVNRVEDDGEWIRSESPIRRPGEEASEGFGRRGDRFERGDRGDRAPRGDRGDRGDRAPRGDRPDRGERREKPAFARGERSERSERPDRGPRDEARKVFGKGFGKDGGRGERGGEGRSGERPSGERGRSFGERPSGERPAGDKPRGARSFGDRDGGGKSGGGKGFGGKSFGEKRFSGDKARSGPGGGKGGPSRGGPSRGGKPSGGGGGGSRGPGGGARSGRPRTPKG
ncbi:pseudouridine synthase [Rhizobium oryzicola]|uniref:Pseudouridine synthase n=1 Tax=Rhizobium oryzicola TaxID=1232668 RepID=A0ABT8SS25_9HYPH|nr:pseudouridine synthase [Rhizobium oryzicola]MDO1581174.1 pseudouridine synthase [Rhizobium oryzicola]